MVACDPPPVVVACAPRPRNRRIQLYLSDVRGRNIEPFSPPMNELLFHSSWWLLACVAAGGIGIFIAGNRRLDKKLQRIGLAVFALAAILGFLRFFFPTPRERMENRSRAIVRAVNDKNWDGLRKLLDPDTALCSPSQVLKGGRDLIVSTAQ